MIKQLFYLLILLILKLYKWYTKEYDQHLIDILSKDPVVVKSLENKFRVEIEKKIPYPVPLPQVPQKEIKRTEPLDPRIVKPSEVLQ